MNPFMVKHIDHIVLRVRELARSIAFYREAGLCGGAPARASVRGRVDRKLRRSR